MLTLPSDLTPHQRRMIDVAVHQRLHPAPSAGGGKQVVEWRWGWTPYGEKWEREEPPRGHTDELLAMMGYSRAPCVGAWPIPCYDAPGPGNNEVAERMLREGSGATPAYYEGSFWFVIRICNTDYRGYGPDLPRAILACAMDWWGIAIPEVEKC